MKPSYTYITYIIVITLILFSWVQAIGQTPSKKQLKIPVKRDTVTTYTKNGTMTIRKRYSGFKFDPDKKEFYDSIPLEPLEQPKRKKRTFSNELK